jgi:hypothetical protein
MIFMGKIICYGFVKDKLWFGKVTLRSLIRTFFRNGGVLEVKPIKGYEHYSYYEDKLRIGIDEAKMTNGWIDKDPIHAIALSEEVSYKDLKAKPSIHKERK